MNRLLALYRSTLGKKIIVAVTGIVMLGFLVGHMAGNLKIFLPDLSDGTPDIDHYAHSLRTLGEPFVPHAALLWTARMGLIVSLVLHVICVMQLSTGNMTARAVDYESRKFARATSPARWMMYTGSFMLLFIFVHLLHLTLGAFGGGFETGKVYNNLQGSFSNLMWAGFYVGSVAVVALHLYHGVWSLFQTLGLDNPDRNQGFRRLAVVASVGLFVGFIAVPTSFLVGIAKAKKAETAAVIPAESIHLESNQSTDSNQSTETNQNKDEAIEVKQ